MMPRNLAIYSARRFYRGYIKTRRQWTVASIEGCMSRGWYLPGAMESDFHPVTMTHLVATIQHFAKEGERQWLTA